MSQNLAAKAKPEEQSSGELYHAPEPEKKEKPADGKIALSFKKDENGNIVLDQVTGSDGAPVQVEIKDGNAEAKAKAEKRAKQEQERRQRKAAAKAEKRKAREEAARLQKEKKEAEKLEKEKLEAEKRKKEAEKQAAEKAAEAEKAEGSKFEKLFGDKETKSAPVAPVQESSDDSGLSEYEKKFGKGKAAAGVAAGAVVGAAAGVAAASAASAVSGAQAVPGAAVAAATQVPAESAAESTVPAQQITESAPEKKDLSPAELLGAEPLAPAVPVEEAADVFAAAAVTAAAEQEAGAQEAPAEPEVPVEPVRPAFIFERDAGIVFERAPQQQPLSVGADTPFTHIPRLESVNAEDYNREFEALRNAAKSDPAPTDRTEFEKKFGTTKAVAPANDTGSMPGYDDGTKDPFAPGSGLEESTEAPAKKSGSGFGSKLKRSIGKLFSSAEEEEE